MKTKWPLNSIAGITAAVIYVIFTLIAFLNYANKYGPLTNWLSDLGNPQVSPSGAVFYNTGCILTSLASIVFYIGLRRWNIGDKKMKRLLTIAQIAGILSAVSLIIAATFPLGPHTSIHAFSSMMLSVFLGFFLTFSATALLKHRAFKKWFAYYGFLTALLNFIYGAILHNVFVAEWVSIGMFIIYVLMIAYNSRLLTSDS